jgi:hypothetical protein
MESLKKQNSSIRSNNNNLSIQFSEEKAHLNALVDPLKNLIDEIDPYSCEILRGKKYFIYF